MFKGFNLKLIGGIVAGLILLALVADRSRWMHRAHVAEAQAAADCSAARAAANNPKLPCDQTDEQIGFLGESLSATLHSLKIQNDAVTSLGEQTKQQQADSAKATQVAQPRAQRAEQISIHLDASARSPADQKVPCEPSEVLKGAWR